MTDSPAETIRDVRKLNPNFGRAGLSVIGPYHRLRSLYRSNTEWFIQESTGVIFSIGKNVGGKIRIAKDSYARQIREWNNIPEPGTEPGTESETESGTELVEE